MNGKRRGGSGKGFYKQGSSMIYVILSMAFLAVFSCGYMAISRYNLKSALNGRNYMEAQLTAKTIHRTFCESVSSGDSEAMNLIWQCFEQDCDQIREEFEEMMEDEEEEGDEDEYGRILESGSRFERYLNHVLGSKEYVVKGSALEAEDGLTADITLRAMPLKEKASVHTIVTCNGYTFSMRADIVFDDSDGAVMTISRPKYSRGHGSVEIYLNGNGVYRYYGDDE